MDHNHETQVRDDVTDTFVRDAEGVTSGGEESDDEESIEIRRKFLIPSDFHDRIKQLGGRLTLEEKFISEYFDRDDYSLMLNDMHLSLRDDGRWELQIGEPDNLASPVSGSNEFRRTLYRQHHAVGDILERLRTQNLLKDGVEGEDLNVIVNSVPFRSCGKFVTVTKAFGVPGANGSQPAKIITEVNDFGINLGEIEVSVDEVAEIPSALKTIALMAKNLDFVPLSHASDQLIGNPG